MKIPFKKNFNENSEVLLRRCGYARQFDKKTNQQSYFKRFGQGHFPKFHVYINSDDPLELSLHLDHKAHTYGKDTAHHADYDGPLVRAEALRIWNAILAQESGK